MMDIFTPNAKQLADYLRSHGKKGDTALAVLAREENFVAALNTELGTKLMAHLVDKHKELLFKIADITATDREKIKYELVREQIAEWAAIINDYYKRLEELLQSDSK